MPGTVKLGDPRVEVESCESTQALLDPSMPEVAIAVGHGESVTVESGEVTYER